MMNATFASLLAGGGAAALQSQLNSLNAQLTQAINRLQVQINALSTGAAGKQPLSAELTALSGALPAGLMTKLGPGSYTSRTLTQGSLDVVLTNPAGATGNPTIGLAALLRDRGLTYTGSIGFVNTVIDTPGAGITRVRVLLRPNIGLWFTYNATTVDGVNFTKDDPAQPSYVNAWEFYNGNVWRFSSNLNGSVTTWNASTQAEREMFYNGVGGWQATTTGTQSAFADQQLKNATAGDLMYFTWTYPESFKAVPLVPTFGTSSSNNVTLGSLTVITNAAYGGKGSIQVTANGDAYWAGVVFAKSS